MKVSYNSIRTEYLYDQSNCADSEQLVTLVIQLNETFTLIYFHQEQGHLWTKYIFSWTFNLSLSLRNMRGDKCLGKRTSYRSNTWMCWTIRLFLKTFFLRKKISNSMCMFLTCKSGLWMRVIMLRLS